MEELVHRLAVLLLWGSSVWATHRGGDETVVWTGPQSSVNRSIYLVAILPNDTDYLPSFVKVGPALKLAMEKVVQQQLLPGYQLQLSFRNSRCSNIFAPHGAVDAYKLNEVHVFFGPSCDYALGKSKKRNKRRIL